MFWRTAFGGHDSDRGWSIAATADEVYICGSTGSTNVETPQEGFPLLEFMPNTSDPASLVDYYMSQSFLVPGGGHSDQFARWRAFHLMMDREDYFSWEISIEGPSIAHDGFIASFTMDWVPVGLPESTPQASGDLWVWPLSDHALYAVRTPYDAQWQGGVFDAAGRRVAEVGFKGVTDSFDLGMAAPGLYLITLHDTTGQRYSAKFMVR